MANNVTPNHAPDFLGGTVYVEVTGPLTGKSIFDGLLANLSTSGLMEKGDYNMDRSRELLRRHLQLMEVDEQDIIRKRFDELVLPYICCSRLVDYGVTVCEISEMASTVSVDRY